MDVLVYLGPLKRFWLAAVFSIVLIDGCSTIADTFTPSNSEGYLGKKGPNIMGGTRLDVDHLTDPACKTFPMVMFIVDTPFSFVLDVVLLPFTLIYSLFR